MEKRLYEVTNGKAYEVAPAYVRAFDINDSEVEVLVIAYNDADAIAQAQDYDRGLVQADNQIIYGEKVVAIAR